jgi:imidazole glycerol-phosphate synthase subunit HisF
MRRIRLIPVLLFQNQGLVKTVKFKNPNYIGDAINSVKIFNDKEVDELIFLDIEATQKKKAPDMSLIKQIGSECFMPLAYGGGITKLDQVKQILESGVEKIVLNTTAFENPNLINQIATQFGSQSIIVSIDVNKNIFGKKTVFVESGKTNTKMTPTEFAIKVCEHGAGEIMINSIERDGTFSGYDIELIKSITEKVSIPVVACGGAQSMNDYISAINIGGASAVAAGSMFVYRGGNVKSILINYPSQKILDTELYAKIIRN